jgi:hypothetical protein
MNNPHLIVNGPVTSCRIEKPFLFLDRDINQPQQQQQLFLGIPAMKRTQAGIDHAAMTTHERIPVLVNQIKSKIVVVTPDHAFAYIHCHIVLSRGKHKWNQILHISKNNQVVLGIGMATIQAPLDGSPFNHVASNAQGVRISGFSLEASAISNYERSTLL